MGAENYGKVQYVALKDTKNLGYIANYSKKISIYTPADYSTKKKIRRAVYVRQSKFVCCRKWCTNGTKFMGG